MHKTLLTSLLLISICFAQNFDLTREFTMTSTNAPSSRSTGMVSTKNNEMYIFGGDNGNFTRESYKFNLAQNTWSMITVPSFVDARGQGSMVWTDSLLYIYGGTNSSQKFNSFITYNPTNNTWTNDVLSSGLSGKVGVSSVFTGTDIIVYGGHDGSYAYGEGRSLNVSTNTWNSSNISTVNNPGPRNGHSAVWTGSEMIIWGGYTGPFANSTIASGGKIYNPNSNTWRNMSTLNAPSARGRHSVMYTGQYMLIWGGNTNTSGNVITLSDGAAYDILNDTWLPLTLTNPLSARYDAYSCYINDRIIIFGGYNYETSTYKSDGAAFTSTKLDISDKINPIDITVFPNPNTGIVNLNLSNLKSTTSKISVYNLVGQIVYQETVTTSNPTINISNLQNGVYLLKVENNGMEYNSRIIKQ